MIKKTLTIILRNIKREYTGHTKRRLSIWRKKEMKINRLCSGLRDRNGHFIFEGDICMRNGDRMELVKICYGEFDVIELEKYRSVDSVKGWYCDVLITDEISLMRPYNTRLPLNNFYIEHWNMEIVRDAEIYDKYSDIEYNATVVKETAEYKINQKFICNL